MADFMGSLEGQGWPQLAALAVALVLCSLIGLERELRQKTAGLRTHTLVGVGAALFMVVSKYGFSDVLGDDVMLDPSRVAAQIASGIGFIGAGVIFVRQDIVRGLTTAATIWVAAAVGTAAGGGLWLVATAVTAAHFLVALGYPPLLRLVTRARPATAPVRVSYLDGMGALRTILTEITGRGFDVREVYTERAHPRGAVIDLVVQVRGNGKVDQLAAALSESEGVLSVRTGEPGEEE
ncbi:MgtC/SapB family protein [Streptomonospora nanhaiensis]|uniref:Putative Mg2+ transporter-C (MgtC) family protein n=2 Tax=Streptomonospora nanhaiensis TaxID=1323731 RepID=A0A853BJ72_9ACTN|nr:MgtC/SapB family protein [Streptomonospora nanhaiensis]NYI94641.1 putative Mg2+ transporter-C (MgtC) family protein [Streptomonospora nanhaiensis]